jgi:putative (di)nucleoside polyphosphate hydrolase
MFEYSFDLYRPNIGICLINKDKKIFSGKRIDYQNWQMPQGGVDFDENKNYDLYENLYREIYEEIGLLKNHFEILEKTDCMFYNFSENILKNIDKNIYANILGQQQIFFYLKFLGKDSDINLNCYINPEFDDWKWETPNFILENCIEMKKSIYEKVLSNFLNI